MHPVWLALGTSLEAMQSQLVLSLLEVIPEGHALQTPLPELICPAGHGSHEAPAAVGVMPAGHESQPSSWLLGISPGLQFWQVLEESKY